MSYLSKAASRPRLVGGFATVLAVGAFFGALTLADPNDEVTAFDWSSLDPNGLMFAMSLETDPQRGVVAAPRIESSKAVSPACGWESDGVAEICQSDWPYPDAQIPDRAAPREETRVVHAANDTDGAVTCGPEFNDGDPIDCLSQK